jgi:hypothetical protein
VGRRHDPPGDVEGWRDVDYEFIENDIGTCALQLSLVHYLAQWAMNYKGRDKRNVIITIDKQGTRWSVTCCCRPPVAGSRAAGR